MRPEKDTDFFIDLPDVGKFRYGRRTYGDRIKIRSKYLTVVEGHGADETMNLYGSFVATHEVLCVSCPDGWEDLTDLDLTLPDNVDDKIFDLFSQLKEKEDSFKKGATKSSEATGEGTQ